MIGDRLPEIIDLVRLSRGSDVVVNFADQAATLFVVDQWWNGTVPASEGCIYQSTLR